MKTTTPAFAEFESTYALICRSEERERSASETAAYVLLLLSIAFSIWQFAHQPIRVPTNLLPTSSVTQSVSAPRLTV